MQANNILVLFESSFLEREWISRTNATLVRSVYLLNCRSMIWIEPNTRPSNMFIGKDGREYALREINEPGRTGYAKGDEMPEFIAIDLRLAAELIEKGRLEYERLAAEIEFD